VSAWAVWIGVGLLGWTLVAVVLVLAIGRASRVFEAAGASELPTRPGYVAAARPSLVPTPAMDVERFGTDPNALATVADSAASTARGVAKPLRILVVDDDNDLRELIRTTFEVAEIEVEEAESARSAAERIASRRPDVVVLDVAMPGVDGLDFCRGLKADPYTADIPVLLLTGDSISERSGREAGAEAFVRKPFSPLALLSAVQRLAAVDRAGELPGSQPDRSPRQLLLYAQDFRRLLELERGQRVLLQDAYRDTVVALARALESKDSDTGAHSERVRRYAIELARAVDETMVGEPSLEYGFILHDIGKIAIPDSILRKQDPLNEAEQRTLETHTVLGEQMVGRAALLRGEGARVVRSHHERWDGTGYPDALGGEDIPLGARVFSVADTLDAITSDRPYRRAQPWENAVSEVLAHSGTQFDPRVVHAFTEREEALRRVYYELNAN
jgi:response regulator RpfG family c-di-GMP phosphodiesterase